MGGIAPRCPQDAQNRGHRHKGALVDAKSLKTDFHAASKKRPRANNHPAQRWQNRATGKSVRVRIARRCHQA